MIKEHQGWELVGIYADEGISGTSLQHRDEFNQMIEDCKAGKIDLIVTKVFPDSPEILWTALQRFVNWQTCGRRWEYFLKQNIFIHWIIPVK